MGHRLLTGSERALVIDGFNRATTALPRPVTVAELVLERATVAPDAVAVVDDGCVGHPGTSRLPSHGGRELTYASLSTAARRLAARLAREGVGRGSTVAICARRSLELVVAQLGVLAAGAACLPLDPDRPPALLASTIEDAGARLLLTGPGAVAGIPAGVPTVGVPDPVAPPRPPGPHDGAGPHHGAGPHDAGGLGSLAYVVPPCGPSSTTAAVEIEHLALSHLLAALGTELGGGPGDTWLSLAPPSCCASIPELLLPLTVGARVVLADAATSPRGAGDPDGADGPGDPDGAALLTLIRRYRVDHLAAPPDTWRRLLGAGLDEPDLFAITAGVDLDLASAVRDRVRRLSVMYGTPEAAVWSTTYPVPVGPDRMSLGRPMANARVYVLDERLRPVPIGVPGEVCVGGAGLARGYRNRPALTAERFLPDPYGAPGDRLFRTGERARWCPGGRLERVGPPAAAPGCCH